MKSEKRYLEALRCIPCEMENKQATFEIINIRVATEKKHKDLIDGFDFIDQFFEPSNLGKSEVVEYLCNSCGRIREAILCF